MNSRARDTEGAPPGGKWSLLFELRSNPPPSLMPRDYPEAIIRRGTPIRTEREIDKPLTPRQK